MEKSEKINLFSFALTILVVGAYLVMYKFFFSSWQPWMDWVFLGALFVSFAFAIFAKKKSVNSVLATASFGLSLFLFLYILVTLISFKF